MFIGLSKEASSFTEWLKKVDNNTWEIYQEDIDRVIIIREVFDCKIDNCILNCLEVDWGKNFDVKTKIFRWDHKKFDPNKYI